MSKLVPFSDLILKEGMLHYLLSLFETTGQLSLQEIISVSRLTKTQTLRALDVLVHSKRLSRDEIKNIFYLL